MENIKISRKKIDLGIDLLRMGNKINFRDENFEKKINVKTQN